MFASPSTPPEGKAAIRQWCLGLACFACYIAHASAQTTTPSFSAAPSDAEIRRILVERIDVQKQGVAIVVGVIDSHGKRVVAYGALEKGDKRPLDGDTLFEIGSITKVFTALLAADMAQRGEVKLDDPIQKYLLGPRAVIGVALSQADCRIGRTSWRVRRRANRGLRVF